MRTHTIRNNKHKTGRILTFSKPMEAKLLAAHPWAMRSFIDLVLKEVGCYLDYDQNLRMDGAIKLIRETSHQEHLILKWLHAGVRLLDTDLEVVLDTLDMAAQRLLPEEVLKTSKD